MNTSDKQVKLIIGLGNPGDKYAATRHNLGFFVLDALFSYHKSQLAEHQYKDFAFEKKLESEIATINIEDIKYILAKPQTFMNLSGQAVQKILAFYHLSPADMLVIHDELDLPLGKLRFSKDASAGGHNGIKSIIESLGSQDFCRLRVGISSSDPDSLQKKMNPADVVLQKFTSEELRDIETITERVLDAAISFFQNGFEKAATKYNK